MDAAARDALAALVRGEVRTELAPELERLEGLTGRIDWLAAEVEELRHRLALVEQRTGLGRFRQPQLPRRAGGPGHLAERSASAREAAPLAPT